MNDQDKKEQVRSIVKGLKAAIDKNSKKLFKEIKEHKNNVYGAIIIKLYTQMLNLESGIRYHLSQGDLYTAKILHRSIIEHSITLQYIWCKEHFIQDDSLTSEHFFITYRIAENVKRFGFDHRIKRIIEENLEKDTVKAYAEHRGEEEFVGRKALDISSQFKLENMIQFLVTSDILKFALNNFNEIYFGAASDYNILSSNVHGGPSALFWDEENDIYNADRISSDLDIFIGMMMKIVIWVYTKSSGDNSIELEASR